MVRKIKQKTVLITCLIFLLLLPALFVFPAGQTPSGKTANDLITEIRYFLNETSASFWTDAELLVHINTAIKNILARTGCLEVSEMFTLDSGTTEYPISTDYMSIKGVIYQSGTTEYKALVQGNRLNLGRVEGDFEEPEYYYDAGGKVGIYPLKDSDTTTVSGNTIYVVMIPMQADLSGASAIPTPACFDRAIVYYAVAQALMKDQQINLANNFMTQYYQELDRFRFDLIDKPEKSLWDIITPKVNTSQ